MADMMHDGISGTLKFFGGHAVDHAEEAFQDGADAILAYAQANAPWADRTGMARFGLNTAIYSEGFDIYLELYHTVDYGKWLELIQAGRFAIIMPTLEHYAPKVFRDAGGKVTGIHT